MLGTDFILDSLSKEGINHIFMVPGGLIDPFLPALGRQHKLRPIVAAQEGGAACMADGYARASGMFGAVLCIGGPGLTNTVTAAATAQTDGSPILIISGETPTYLEGLGMFQDATAQTIDDVATLKGLTRYSSSIDNPKNLGRILRRAMVQLLTKPAGPVHLSIPVDSQKASIEAVYQPVGSDLNTSGLLSKEAAETTIDHFTGRSNNQTPMRIAILAGAGAEHSDAAQTLRHFAEKWHIPVATTLRAKGVFPEDHPLSLGVFGYAGTLHAKTTLIDESLDLLLVLGSGLNERDTMHWTLHLEPKHAVCVNLNPLAMETRLTGSCVVGDVKAYLEWLQSQEDRIRPSLETTLENRKRWLSEILSGPRRQDPENCRSNASPIHPARAIAELRKAFPKDGIVLIDSGAHRAFAGHYWTANEPITYISATNLGPMGWAIPAAIGVQCAKPDKKIAVITGDGCMRMQGIEVATAARYHFPIVYVVINNSALGNVWLRAHQKGPVPDELTSLPDIDWAAFSRSLGGYGITVSDPALLPDAFSSALNNSGPTVIDVKADKHFLTPVTEWAKACAAWSYHE